MNETTIPAGFERRMVGAQIELRASDDDPPKIVGHAAVFDSLSEDLGGFREKISPGAFKDAIPVSDIRSLWNHDSNIVLGRTKSGTLRVEEDDHGLHTETDPPDTQLVRDMVRSPIERGDVDQMSFAFRIHADGDHWEDTADGMVRTILPGGVAELFDISPVTFAAYQDTDVGVRSLCIDTSVAEERMRQAARDDRALAHALAEYEYRRRWLEIMRLAAS